LTGTGWRRYIRGQVKQILVSALRLLDRLPDALRRGRHLDVLDASSASASTIALTTAPSAGVVPPSPPPRSPRGCDVDGTSLISVVNDGSMSARGTA
jgi:hypothetical protein